MSSIRDKECQTMQIPTKYELKLLAINQMQLIFLWLRILTKIYLYKVMPIL